MENVTAKDLNLREVSLTCKGLRFVNWDYGDDDFEFVFSDDKVCRVPTVLAEFLSPKVSRIRRCDPLCSVYLFKKECSQLFDAFEGLISTLRAGGSCLAEKSNFVALLRISQELENGELLAFLLEMIPTESMMIEDATFLLRSGIDFGIASSDRLGKLRDFVASHFHEIEKQTLDSLDLETSQFILSSPSLQLENEDSLYDFVVSRSQNDLRFANLFEFVHFEYLSVDRIKDFASFVSENLLENINPGIWARICDRLILDTKLKRSHRNRDIEITFVYDSSKPLKGIIEYLTRECGGNVHDKGIVNVTASSVSDRSYHQRHAVDIGTDSVYESNDEENSWLCYDFKELRVIPTSYSVRTHGYGSAGRNLRSWVFEVSNDGKSWTQIDRRDNNYDLNDTFAIQNFKISDIPSERFRFVRLRQTGMNHASSYRLKLTALEIYGILFEK